MEQCATVKKPSSPELIRALIEQNSVTKAAQALECSRSTIYRRLQDPEFVAELEAARQLASDAEIDAMIDLRRHQCALSRRALGFLADVLEDPEAPRSVRVSVAQRLLTYAEPAAAQLEKWSEQRRSHIWEPIEAMNEPAQTRVKAQAEGLSD